MWTDRHSAEMLKLHEGLVQAMQGAQSLKDCYYAAKRLGWPSGPRSQRDTPADAVQRQLVRTAAIQALQVKMEAITEKVAR